MLALWFAQVFVAGILQRHADMLQVLGELGLNFAPILKLVPPLVFIVVYALGFKITSLIIGAIVKNKRLKREKKKLRMLELK